MFKTAIIASVASAAVDALEVKINLFGDATKIAKSAKKAVEEDGCSDLNSCVSATAANYVKRTGQSLNDGVCAICQECYKEMCCDYLVDKGEYDTDNCDCDTKGSKLGDPKTCTLVENLNHFPGAEGCETAGNWNPGTGCGSDVVDSKTLCSSNGAFCVTCGWCEYAYAACGKNGATGAGCSEAYRKMAGICATRGWYAEDATKSAKNCPDKP